MDKVISMKSIWIRTIEPELYINIFFLSPMHALKEIIIILRIFIEEYINAKKTSLLLLRICSEIPKK